MTPSPEDIERAKTKAGGFSKESFKKLGVPWPPRRHWKRRLEARWRREQRAKVPRGAHLDDELDLNEWL